VIAKRITIVFILSGLVLLLVSCGGSESVSTETGNTDVGKQASNEPIELVFYSPGSNGVTQEDFMDGLGNSIQQKFPNYKLTNITKQNDDTLNQLVAAGQSIDIMSTSIIKSIQFMLPVHAQSDISDLIKKNKYDISRLEPSTVQAQQQLANGGIYGLPTTTTSVALFYNKDLFDKFGVAYPKDGMTWDDLYELTKKMTRTDSGQQYKGLAINFLKVMDLEQLSPPWVDPKTFKALLDKGDAARAFTNLVRFFQIPGNGLPDPKYNQGKQVNAFLKDKTAAMLLNDSGYITKLEDLVNWDVVQVPFYKDKMGIGPQSDANYLFVSSLSKHRDEAFKVLEYVTSEEYQTARIREGKFSILKDASKYMAEFGADLPYLKGKNIKSLIPEKYAVPAPITVYDAIARDELKDTIGDVANGVKDVNTALRETAERVDKAIAEQRK
jgi:multiple sugar transport system substrate-binding protein